MEIIKKQFILEQQNMRAPVRAAVKDIVTIYKNNDEGEFYLPEELGEEMEYVFPLGSFSVELTLEQSDEIEDFKIDGGYYRKEFIVSINIVYNPKVKEKIIYDLVGELNEVVAHELRHFGQVRQGIYDLDVEDEETGYEYYSQPHEIDAQVFGFRRMSKVTNRPFDELVTRWFKTHKDIHEMGDEDVQKVIELIHDRNSKI